MQARCIPSARIRTPEGPAPARTSFVADSSEETPARRGPRGAAPAGAGPRASRHRARPASTRGPAPTLDHPRSTRAPAGRLAVKKVLLAYPDDVASPHTLAITALVGLALTATTQVAAAQAPIYDLGATQSCLAGLPNAVLGLPPADPPVPPALFVYPLAHDAISTWDPTGSPPRAHKQLGAWYGDARYQGIILSFFKSVRDAGASLKSLAWLYGGKQFRNVVATWDQKSAPSRSVRNAILRCLRSEAPGKHPPSPGRPPRASLATFAGAWGGHDRGFSITSTGRGLEGASDGCCTPVYQMAFQIVSVTGTLTRAVAMYRVTSFKRYEAGVKRLHPGAVGKLLLRNGIVTNTLTGDFFCSNPAWGATGACGA